MNKTLILLLMVLTAMFLNADNLVLSPNIDAIEAEFGVSDTDIGNISALFVVIGAAVSLLWGYLGDKGSRKLLFVLSIVIGEIPCALTAFALNWPQFFWLRILSGIGVGASFPIAFSLIGDLFDERQRGTASAFLAAAIGFGTVIGTLVGGYGGAVWGWRLPFVAVAAPNFLFALIFWLYVREPQRGMSEEGFKELAEQGYIYPRSIKLSDYRRLFTIPTNLYLFLQGIAGCVPWGAIPLFLVPYLTRVRGYDVTSATTVFLVFGLGNIVGNLAGGVIGGALHRRSPRLVPFFCGVTTVAGMLLAVLVFQASFISSYWAIVVLGFFTSICVSLTGPNVKMMLMDVNVPENRAAIFSVFNFTDSLGNGIGRAVGGWLSGLATIGPAMTVASLFWLPCGVLLVVLAPFFLKDVLVLRAEMRSLADQVAGSAAPSGETG